MAKAVKKEAGKINVKFGKLVEPLKVYKIVKGSTLEDFLETAGIAYDASIRVNGAVMKRSAKLSEGDIITSINAVAGGR